MLMRAFLYVELIAMKPFLYEALKIRDLRKGRDTTDPSSKFAHLSKRFNADG